MATRTRDRIYVKKELVPEVIAAFPGGTFRHNSNFTNPLTMSYSVLHAHLSREDRTMIELKYAKEDVEIITGPPL